MMNVSVKWAASCNALSFVSYYLQFRNVCCWSNDHIIEAYYSIVFVTALYTEGNVSLCFPHIYIEKYRWMLLNVMVLYCVYCLVHSIFCLDILSRYIFCVVRGKLFHFRKFGIMFHFGAYSVSLYIYLLSDVFRQQLACFKPFCLLGSFLAKLCYVVGRYIYSVCVSGYFSIFLNQLCLFLWILSS